MLGTLRETLRSFAAHGGRVLGAATAFYALLSVAPMLLIAIAVTGQVVDEASARAQVVSNMALWIGEGGGQTLGALLDNLAGSQGALTSALGAAVLVWASTRLFSQLRYSLNHMWGVRERTADGTKIGIRAWFVVRKRLAALLMVVVVVLSVVSMVLTKVALSAAARHVGAQIETRWHLLEFVLSFLALAVLCAAVFKLLPAARIAWRDALVGALVTALLFSLGTALIGWYLGFKGTESTYGAAGSLVALLLWVNYSAQVFFLGAAFTRAFAERHGRGLVLAPGAVRVVEQEAPIG
ncbi:MAG: YihY/virulence factor BrkB family protein [Sandaracinaceae bacterium]|nr:YihY/virulence factor BrkB family protein [Sandaracinaceae bacterium]